MIEDNLGDVTLIKEALNIYKINAELLIAKNGEEALDFINDKLNSPSLISLPDLIILDLNIPRLDGRYVLNAIRQKEILNKVPVVIFTSSSYDIDEKTCSELGANLFLTKPIEFDQYGDIINSIKILLDNTASSN
jgi:two-component system, chemotaxis family, response regulator Rcp1